MPAGNLVLLGGATVISGVKAFFHLAEKVVQLPRVLPAAAACLRFYAACSCSLFTY
ncbi:hypothetical protein E2C01_079076 [Portunus trituberculatus]|uniref:Uncharacterized protein n=1 Tax=Portunus trituberculatus TaxID=210409 RepID=A0A5B7IQH0_PORTR|nr:hypothetical protein [Portunus trituberculatus]